MNEKLKNLMLEAGYAAPELATRAQKLSQLLIQECIRILEEQKIQVDENLDDTDWMDATWNNCINQCVNRVHNIL